MSRNVLTYSRPGPSVIGRWAGPGMMGMAVATLVGEWVLLRWEAVLSYEMMNRLFWGGTLAGFGAIAVACLPQTRLYQRFSLLMAGTLLLVMGLLRAFDVM
ncbi:MAG TPA: hypothetical protein VH253_20660 [Phycisphaerae bacterium]|nr:hypothetical protein [Phycisphaerae bacterium]